MQEARHEPSKEQIRAIHDLTSKVMIDVHKALDTPLDLVKSIGGNGGIYVMTQKLAEVFVMGAAMTIAAMRDGDLGEDRKEFCKNHRDDMLFAALVAANSEHPNILQEAQDMFFKIKGRKHDVPFS